MKNYIYISLLSICISTNAQINVVSNFPEVDSIFSSKLTGELFYESKQYIGDQYFNKDWTRGSILLSTGEIIYNKLLKYNGLFDELIWLNNRNFGKFKLDKPFINEFWFENTLGANTHFKRISVSESSQVSGQNIFVEIEVEGKVSLYVYRQISLQWPEYIYINNNRYRYDVLKAMPKYYIKLPSNHYFIMSKLRSRTFLKLFPDKKKSISKIIKDNHLNVNTESDFTKLIELMNKEVTL